MPSGFSMLFLSAFLSQFFRHGYNRFLTIYKRARDTSSTVADTFSLIKPSRQQIQLLLKSHPVTPREKQELMPCLDRTHSNERKLNWIFNRGVKII